MPTNLQIINERNPKVIAALLKPSAVYCTNGIYALPAEKVVPTVLAAYEYISDTLISNDPVMFVVAMNSDQSVERIREARIDFEQKNGSDPESIELKIIKIRAEITENEQVRALKVAEPLAKQHPDKQIRVVFYDEETPADLYRILNESGVQMPLLFKYGYGTDKSAPPIVGAQYFGATLAFPFVTDVKPICYDITHPSDTATSVCVEVLHKPIDGLPKSPYLSSDSKVMFPVHSDLSGFSANGLVKSPLDPAPIVKPYLPYVEASQRDKDGESLVEVAARVDGSTNLRRI